MVAQARSKAEIYKQTLQPYFATYHRRSDPLIRQTEELLDRLFPNDIVHMVVPEAKIDEFTSPDTDLGKRLQSKIDKLRQEAQAGFESGTLESSLPRTCTGDAVTFLTPPRTGRGYGGDDHHTPPGSRTPDVRRNGSRFRSGHRSRQLSPAIESVGQLARYATSVKEKSLGRLLKSDNYLEGDSRRTPNGIFTNAVISEFNRCYKTSALTDDLKRTYKILTDLHRDTNGLMQKVHCYCEKQSICGIDSIVENFTNSAGFGTLLGRAQQSLEAANAWCQEQTGVYPAFQGLVVTALSLVAEMMSGRNDILTAMAENDELASSASVGGFGVESAVDGAAGGGHAVDDVVGVLDRVLEKEAATKDDDAATEKDETPTTLPTKTGCCARLWACLIFECCRKGSKDEQLPLMGHPH